jgi:GNAT superfamily N-acetyltransferase
MSSSPPEGFRVRPATQEDVAAINELVVAADEAVMGWSDSTEADLIDWWRQLDLERDSWLAENGGLAAYGVLYPHGETAELDGYVHPVRTGRGLGRWLLARGEERAGELGLSKAQGDEIAGVLRGEPNRFGTGWVGALGVREGWRKRGIGLALLRHAFAEFHRRGETRIALGVDAQNPTGATRLYERAGMRVAYEAIAFEKELT